MPELDAPAPLAAPLPRQSGVGFLPPHHLGGAHRRGAGYPLLLWCNGWIVAPCALPVFPSPWSATTVRWSVPVFPLRLPGGVRDTRNNECHVCARRRVGEAAGSFRRSGNVRSRPHATYMGDTAA